MTETLLNWLNNEVKLSKKINDFSKSFANGYLFGELLYKYNLLPQFNQFEDSNEKSSITKNYILLQHKFSELNIPFTDNDKNELIKQQKYKARILLFEIRKILMSKFSNINEILLRKKNGTQTDKIIKSTINNKLNLHKNKIIDDASNNAKKRPISAILPNIKNITNEDLNTKRKFLGYNSLINKNPLNEKEKKQVTDALNEIEFFDKNHLNNKKNIEFLEKSKHINEINKTQKIVTSWKESRKIMKQHEEEKNKKELSKLNRLKSATQRTFIKNSNDSCINIDKFNKYLDRLGVNANNELKEDENNKMTAENYMKSIIEEVKQKEKSKKQYETRLKRIQTPKTKICIPDKISEKNTQEVTLKTKRPQTSSTTVRFMSANKKGNKSYTTTNFYTDNNFKKNCIKENILEKVNLGDVKKEEKYVDDTGIYNEKLFFEEMNNLNRNVFSMQAERRKEKYIKNRKNIKNVVYSLIDITNLCYELGKDKQNELVDINEWNKIISNFINNEINVKEKGEEKNKTQKIVSNINFDLYNKINTTELTNYGQYEYDELKNYINSWGKKYNSKLNNIFTTKLKLGQNKINIKDIIEEETKDKPNVENSNEDDKKKYKASKEELELLEPFKEKMPQDLIFTNLISEVIKFSYDKDPKTYIPNDPKIISKIEEENVEKIIQHSEVVDNENNQKKVIGDTNGTPLPQASSKNKLNNEIKQPETNPIVEHSFKEILKNIPIKLSFLGLKNICIKNANNLIGKFSNLKVYCLGDIISDLREKHKIINEPINEVGLKRFEIEKLKKRNNLLFEEIKNYTKLIKNENNLNEDEILLELLIQKIKEDFKFKEKEEIVKSIKEKRDLISNINIERQELEKKSKPPNVNAKDLKKLDEMTVEAMRGFIIIDFPKTMAQIQLMEKKLMNFVQPCEKNKTIEEVLQTKLLSICDKNQYIFKINMTGENELTFDKIILFESEKSNIETDMELVEKFYNTFSRDNDSKYFYHLILNENYVTNNINTPLIEINNNVNTKKKDNQITNEDEIKIFNEVNELLKIILNVYEEKMDPILNLGLENSSDVYNNLDIINEKESSKKISIDSFKNNNINKREPDKKAFKDSQSSITINDSRINSNNLNTSKGEVNASSKINLFPNGIPEKEFISTYQVWTKLIYQYTNSYYEIFYSEKQSNEKNFVEKLNEMQHEFITFLSRSSNKNILINQFFNKYKKFSKQYWYIQEDQTIKNKYLSDIDELFETLWKVVEIRKLKDIEKIEYYTKQNFVDNYLNTCYFKSEKMIILETQKFIEIINILIRFSYSSSKLITSGQIPQFASNCVTSKEVLKNCENCALAKDNTQNKSFSYPRADQIYKNCLKILINLNNFLNKFSKTVLRNNDILTSVRQSIKTVKKKKSIKKNPLLSRQPSSTNAPQFNQPGNVKSTENQNPFINSIKIEIDKYRYIIYNLYMNLLENLTKIFYSSKLVFQLMNDWVIDSIQYQNNAMNFLQHQLKTIKISEIEKKSHFINVELDNFSNKYKAFNYDDFILSNTIESKISNVEEEKLNIIKIYEFFNNVDDVNNCNFISLIKKNEIQNGLIRKFTFENIFFIDKLIKNNDKNLLPPSFYRFDFHNISLFFSHFVISSKKFKFEINEEKFQEKNTENKSNNKKDFYSESPEPQELIYTNIILTILVLYGFQIPSYMYISRLKSEICDKLINGYLKENDFNNINFWFEDDLNNSFTKNKEKRDELYKGFKTLLFNINKNSKNLLNLDQFIDIITLKSLNFEQSEAKEKINKYYNLFYN